MTPNRLFDLEAEYRDSTGIGSAIWLYDVIEVLPLAGTAKKLLEERYGAAALSFGFDVLAVGPGIFAGAGRVSRIRFGRPSDQFDDVLRFSDETIQLKEWQNGVPIAEPVYSELAFWEARGAAAAEREALIVQMQRSAEANLAVGRQVSANKTVGDAVRDLIMARENARLAEAGKAGKVTSEEVFHTVGGIRREDVVVRTGEEIIGIESKVGRTGPTPRVRQELARDFWLLRQGQQTRKIWEFSRSPITGKVGPTPSLLEKLRKLGIEVRVNP